MMVTTDTTFEKQNGEKENAQNGEGGHFAKH